jgi:hypothetical protein
VRSVGSAFPLFDGSFSTDSNLGPGFGFHFLQSVSTRTDK